MSPDDVVKYMCDHIGKNRCVVIPGAMNRIAKILPADLKMKFVSLKKKREINH
jgi:hypothetical protein